MIFRSWLSKGFASCAPPRRPVAGRWRPHRKPLQRDRWGSMGIDCSAARLLDAGWLKLSWPQLNSGRFAWFRKVAGFDALSGVPHARAPEESSDSWFGISRKTL